MGYTFTFGDIEKLCRALGWHEIPGRRAWRHIDRGRRMGQISLHSHGAGKEVATGTVKTMAKQLGFHSLAEMAEYLRKL